MPDSGSSGSGTAFVHLKLLSAAIKLQEAGGTAEEALRALAKVSTQDLPPHQRDRYFSTLQRLRDGVGSLSAIAFELDGLADALRDTLRAEADG